jgi:hypothetical protein
MPRVQVGYDPRAEALQTIAAPNIRTEQARVDPNASKAFQLAAALGAPSVQQGLDQITQRVNESEKDKATAYANSMTIDELGKQIKEGKILQSQSPIYAATVQHIYGENSIASFERDTLSKMDRGELKFNSQQELDKYITEHRDKTLAGQSEYTIAGFDKKYTAFRENISAANTRLLDSQFVQRGTQEANDNLSTILEENRGKPPAEAAAAIVNRYQLLRKTSLLKDEQGKEALSNLFAQLAADGNVDMINELSRSKLDNGITVGGVLGGKVLMGIQQHAVVMQDKNERQRVDVEIRPFVEAARKGELDPGKFDEFVKKNERFLSTPTIEAVKNSQEAALERAQREADRGKLLAAAEQSQAAAQQAVDVSVAAGTAFALKGKLKVVSPTTGQLEDFDSEKAAAASIERQVQDKKLQFPQQVQLYTANGIENPQWKSIVQAGVSNLASVGWSYDGKNIGQLNQAGQAAIQTYLDISQVNPAEADKYAGSKENQRLLSDIKFMMEKGGMPNLSDAAAFVNQVNRRGIEGQDASIKRDQVKNAVDDIVNPSFYSSSVNWVKTLFGGNEEVNLTAIGSDIRRRAELLVQSGQVSDAKAAVRASVEYFANPAVTAKINNTVYFRKDLPQVPEGQDQGEWFGRFIKEVPGKIASDQKMEGSRIRLESNQSGGYTAWIAGVPLTDANGQVQNYTKDQVGEWISNTITNERNQKVRERQAAVDYEAWGKRVVREYSEKNPQPYGTNAALTYMTSKGAYEYFKQQGVLDRPVSELMDIIKKKGK